jgi:hypothetical protein
MPALLLSERSVAILNELVDQHGSDKELKDIRSQLKVPIQPAQEGAVYPDGAVIDHRCLVQVSKWSAANQDKHKGDLSLTNLLRGAQVAIAIQPKPARVSVVRCEDSALVTDFVVKSLELIETLRKIKLMQEQEEYDRMMAPSDIYGQGLNVNAIFQASKENENPWRQTKSNRTEAEEWEEVRKQIGAIINVGLSVAAVATATWWAGGNADPIWVSSLLANKRVCC